MQVKKDIFQKEKENECLKAKWNDEHNNMQNKLKIADQNYPTNKTEYGTLDRIDEIPELQIKVVSDTDFGRSCVLSSNVEFFENDHQLLFEHQFDGHVDNQNNICEEKRTINGIKQKSEKSKHKQSVSM